MSSWTTSAGLVVSLDAGSAVSLQRQLEAALRDHVRSGRLAAGTRVPSTRALASELGVARGTVVGAYEQLVAEGYLVGTPGSGTVVSERAVAQSVTAAPSDVMTAPVAIDFRRAIPDLSSFPRALWMRSVRSALASMPDDDLGYVDSAGTVALQASVARHLGVNRGVVADAGDVVVVNGFAQALSISCHALRALGHRTIGVEDPGSFSSRDVIRTAGLEPVGIPVDDDGLDVAVLARSGVRAVLVTPAHQYPLGVVLSPARRHALTEWARATDGFVIEDDYDEQYRYDRKPVGALQALAPDRVAYGGSVSKTLAPALRLGWLVAPPALRDRLVAVKKHIDHGTASIDQVALARLIDAGDLDRHLRRTRKLYAARRAALVDACAAHLPTATVSGIAGGLHAVVTVGDVDEDALVDACASRGIAVVGLRSFALATVHPAALVLAYGSLTEREIESGVATIADATHAATGDLWG
jgi:GntR family transcriptional regulator / MocR family aminotransferase